MALNVLLSFSLSEFLLPFRGCCPILDILLYRIRILENSNSLSKAVSLQVWSGILV